jgi:phosphate transport system substrate-binding protein
METKRRFSAILLSLATAAFVAPAFCQTITIKTSDTLAGIGQKWAEAYVAAHAGAKIEATGGATTAAFAALAERKASIAMVPRGIRFKEAQPCEAAFGSRPTEFKVAVNGVAVYVSANNPAKVLTYAELEEIFKGKQRNWKGLGGKDAPIVVYGVATNTPAGELFMEEVLTGGPPANDIRLLAGTELLNAIARDPNAIGFGPLAQAEGVRALNIKRVFSSTPVAPSEDAISNRIYPISRWLYCYLDPTANKNEIKAYLDWIRSDTGQQIAKQAGYYPLPAKWRATP